MVITMSKCESPDEDAALSLDHHRLPEGRRIHWALDPVPWRLRIVESRGAQLRKGRDVTGRGVDEELAHVRRR